MSARDVVVLRGEHLSNLYDYMTDPAYRLHWDESQGYNAEFARRHDEIVVSIISSPQQMIRIVTGLDDLCNCGCCPNKAEKCESPQILEKDRAVAGTYDLVIGEEYEIGDVIGRLVKKGRWDAQGRSFQET